MTLAPRGGPAPHPESPPALQCRVCGNVRGNRTFLAQERMFGLGGCYEYLECAGCGCLQLPDPPTDPAALYPPGYYSFQPRTEAGGVRFLKQVRLAHGFGRRSLLGALLVRRYGLPPDVAAVIRTGVGLDASLLDVGCGDGRLLRDLHAVGFRSLRGVDPHLPSDLSPAPGVAVQARELAAVEGRFDLVMLHHSFEHMADPAATLAHARRLLHPGGLLLLRIPVADSHSWRRYGPAWVQLDAPRHLFLHTRRSVEHLAAGAAFRVRSVVHDSSAFQFWGSEQYLRGLSLHGPGATGDRPRPGIFSRAALRAWARLAEELNRAGEGDQAAFLLEPV